MYAEGRLFVAPADADRLFALNAATGRQLWESKPVEVQHLFGVAQDRLIFTTGSKPRGIRALVASTGADIRTWLQPGDGRIMINDTEDGPYFCRPTASMIIRQPFDAVEQANKYDVWATVRGGGVTSQAGAVRHGISRALVAYDPTLRPPLKAGGFLTRDSRKVERKKYGLRKARRSFQFSKR